MRAVGQATPRVRRNERAVCTVRGRVLGRHGFASGVVHNLSVGGLFFSGRNLSVGEQAEVEFHIRETRTIRATCEVLYRKRHGEGAGIGVRFLTLDAGSEAEIRRFLATHRVEVNPAFERALQEQTEAPQSEPSEPG